MRLRGVRISQISSIKRLYIVWELNEIIDNLVLIILKYK